MDFRILGTLEVGDAGRLLELRSQKQRALLAILLLHVGEWLSADALIDALWGERPPETARFALRNHIAGLRRALGPDLILSREGGYQLEVGVEQVDLKRFERLLDESRAAEGRERVERLQEALELWRGPALADLVYEPFADREAARLEELRVSALEELVDAELMLGRGPELVERLEALVAEHPYRERLRGQLMLALYRGGRQVEALECFRQARRTLVEELGIEPGGALRELEQAILRQDPSLQSLAPARELPPFAERRAIVTVLFAELLLPEPLDPELRRTTSAQALTHVRTVLEAHGAAIEQRASEELMGVFGLPLAHEDDALRAARAALELQADAGDVELRVALESGEVLAGVDGTGHGFVTGAVVPAARHLLEQTRPGDVLVGKAALGLLSMTAVVEPVVQRMAGRLLALAEDAVRATFDAPFVGRRDELAALRAAFTEVVADKRCRLHLLLGEAGVGKTRLAAELARELEAQATIARGRCLAYGQALTFWPLVEALRSLGEPARGALKQLLAGGASSPQQLAWSVRQAFERAAAERPLLVLLDDLHWAEAALLEVLKLVSELSSDTPALLLCLARPELLERHPGWLQGGEQAGTLRLGPLSQADCKALLETLPQSPNVDEQEQLIARAGGNPLFLEELSAFLGDGRGAGELPPRLWVLLQARLDQLPEPERLVLATAALEGSVFHLGALATLLPDELGPALPKALAALTATRLIFPTATELEGQRAYRFRHELIRDTAYRALPKNERADLHERFADWLVQHSRERAELAELAAYHLEQAAVLNRDMGRPRSSLEQRAASSLANAANLAQLRADPCAAAGLWRRSLRLLDDDDARVPEVQLELALQLESLGRFAEAEQLLATVEGGPVDPAPAAAARLARLQSQLSSAPQGVPEAIRVECAESIPLFEQRRDSRALARAWYARAWAEWVELQVLAATRAFEAAAAHAQAAKDRRLEMDAQVTCVFLRAAACTSFATGVQQGKRLAEEYPGEPEIEMILSHLRAFAAFDDGPLAPARVLAAEALAADRRAGYTMYAGAMSAIYARLELLAGDIDKAERLVLAGIDELERHDDRGFLSGAETVLAEIRLAQGRFGEALQLVHAAEHHGGADDLDTHIRAASIRARAHARLDALGEARDSAEEAVTISQTTDSLEHQAEAEYALADVLRAAAEFPGALAAAAEADRLWTALGRNLSRRRTAALIEQIQRRMAATGTPAPAA